MVDIKKSVPGGAQEEIKDHRDTKALLKSQHYNANI
jgi:hypothetical protein